MAYQSFNGSVFSNKPGSTKNSPCNPLLGHSIPQYGRGGGGRGHFLHLCKIDQNMAFGCFVNIWIQQTNLVEEKLPLVLNQKFKLRNTSESKWIAQESGSKSHQPAFRTNHC